MLKEKQKVHRIDLSRENPCFVIEDGCDDTKHVHVHRKQLTSETEAPISGAASRFICGNNAGNTCGKDMYQPAVVHGYEEWHSVSGTMKKVCLNNPVWLQEPGVWVIDIYEEIKNPPEITEKPDPQNFYRKLVCDDNLLARRLCKTYEFVLPDCCDVHVDGEGRGCEGQYTKCTT